MYLISDFRSYYADIVKFANLTDPPIQRAIDIVQATWGDFQCYSSDKYSLLYHLAVAHNLELSGSCIDSSTPWFNPSTVEVKSYNDQVKFASNDGDLEMTTYGRQLKKLLSQSTNPMLYFGGLSRYGGGNCG